MVCPRPSHHLFPMRKTKLPQKLKDLVIKALRNHAWNMGVSHYTGDIIYMENDKDASREVLADIDVSRRYLRGTIQIYPKAVKRWELEGDKAMTEVIAHEVAHILTSHLADLASSPFKSKDEFDDAHEALTEKISRMSMRIEELEKR